MMDYGHEHADTAAWADQEGVVDNVVPLVRDMHQGQLRIAEKFRDAYADTLLYVHGIGWHHWCGTHWVEDRDGEAWRCLTDLLKDLRHESVDLPKTKQDALLSDVRKCESSAGISGVLNIAKHLRPMTTAAEHTNTDPALFNCRNGTLNLETGEIQPHNPRDLITKCASTEIDPDACSQMWDDFLNTVLPDESVRAYLGRVFGVAMLGSVREHTLPILTGTGGNGKSVCVDTVMAAFGDYGKTVDPKLVMKTKHQQHGTFMADLHGARLVVTSETADGATLDTATVKRITGGDRIRANRMAKDTFEFAPSHTLCMVTNHTPKAAGDDKALWRRLTVVPFDVVVANPDRKLPEKLRAHLAAVLAWCFTGWQDYQERGMDAPETVLVRTEEYRSEGDPLGQFINEMCVTGPHVYIASAELFGAWLKWCTVNGQASGYQKDFKPRILDHGFEDKRSSSGIKFLGLSLAETTLREPTFDL